MKRRRPSSYACRSAGRITASLLLSFLAVCPHQASAGWANGWDGVNQLPLIPIPESTPHSPPSPAPAPAEHDLSLRHIFHRGTYRHPNLHRRLDVRPQDSVWMLEDGKTDKEPQRSFHVRSRGEKIQRLADRRYEVVDALMSSARLSGYTTSTDISAWTVDEVPAPNVTDKETVLNMAIMAANAYIKVPGTEDWHDVNSGFNLTDDFGWEGDGLRGHIFADEGNTTVVIALKGTTPAVFDGSGSTSNDKENDNLFFSCCCGQGGRFLWRRVCDCTTSAYTCNSTCLLSTLHEKNRYYQAALDLYGNVTELYPDSNIWMSGHSLGGSVSSFLGLTYGLPVTTFESVPDALPAKRLGLPAPPGTPDGLHQARQYTGANHFGHTADPIFVGTCNAATSACTLGGYAMETQCHTGKVCIYDTVEDKKWRVSASTHSIRYVITDVIKAYDQVPECIPDSTEEEPCVDCFNWKYFKSNGSEGGKSKTSSSSTSTTLSLTRTTTCHTPGWWGCLDESTTTSSTVPRTTETITTSVTTCLRWGWFGDCLDPTTTKTTITTTVPLTPTIAVSTETITAPVTTCLRWGWFGSCLDPATSNTTVTTTVPLTATVAISTQTLKIPVTTCLKWGWFGLGPCIEPVTSDTTITTTVPLTPSIAVTTQTTAIPVTACLRWKWWGLGPCVEPVTSYMTTTTTVPLTATRITANAVFAPTTSASATPAVVLADTTASATSS